MNAEELIDIRRFIVNRMNETRAMCDPPTTNPERGALALAANLLDDPTPEEIEAAARANHAIHWNDWDFLAEEAKEEWRNSALITINAYRKAIGGIP